MLKAYTEDGDVVLGEDAVKDARYLCPECSEPVTFKAGRIVVPHFAHKPPHHCEYGTGESARHHEMKLFIGRMLADCDPDYELALLSDRRADVVLAGPRIVIECQASKISVGEWDQRTRDYNRAGWGVMWVWDMKRLGKPQHDEYRVPDEIRFCHQESYGRVLLLAYRHLFAAHFYAMFRPPTDWPDSTGYYPRTLRAMIKQELPQPLRPRRVKSSSGLTLVGFGEGVWWKRFASAS